MRTARNVAIVVVIAAAVAFIPGGGRVASTFEAALWVAFGLGFGFLAVRFYREHRISIYSLGDAHRALLYAGVVVALFAWASRARMWQTGFGEFVWFLLVGFVVYAFLEAYRRWRAY
jgi:hypothetical protein